MPRLRRRALRRKVAAVDPLDAVLGDAVGAERVRRFIEGLLVHTKGECAGEPFRLLPFQLEALRGLFDPATVDGNRRVRSGLLFWPRKTGKTTFAAALGLYATFADGEIGGQAVTAANSREQASLLFNTAADMLELSPVLRERAVVSRATKRITDRVTRTVFRALSSDAGTAHGLDCHFWIYDELHASSDRELYDVLQTSTGARRQPMGLVISTAGFDKNSVLGGLYEHAKRWESDPSIDPHFYAHLAEAAEDEPWDVEATWRRANPALGAHRSLEELRIAAHRAKLMPAERAAFERLYLNRWTKAENAWLDMAAWDECAEPVPLEHLAGRACYGGLDLSATIDLTAFVLNFPVEDRFALVPYFFVPGEGLVERERRDRVPYRAWAERGLLEITPGPTTDYRYVVGRVLEAAKRFRLKIVGYDRWGAADLVTQLEQNGLEVARFGQGYSSMSAPTKRLQELVLQRRIMHGGHPVLRWNAECTTVASDPSGNIKPVKADRLKSSRRIDGIVAAIMALGVSAAERKTDLSGWLKNPISF